MLGKHVVHRLANGNQGQNLQREEAVRLAFTHGWVFVCGRLGRGKPFPHHDGEDDGSHGGLEDPEEGQTQALDEGEEVDASLWDVPQVDQVWLVLGRHQEQLQAVHELKQTKKREKARCSLTAFAGGAADIYFMSVHLLFF